MEKKSQRIYYTMGEVSEMFDVKPSLIRFWEQKFDVLKPDKNRKGNRLFTPRDVDNLKMIYHLVKENGMTLAGAAKRMHDNREGTARDMEIIEKLQGVRALLMEVREELKSRGGEVFVDTSLSDESAIEPHAVSVDEAQPKPARLHHADVVSKKAASPEHFAQPGMSTTLPIDARPAVAATERVPEVPATPDAARLTDVCAVSTPESVPEEHPAPVAVLSDEVEGPAVPRFLQREIPIPQPSEIVVPEPMPEPCETVDPSEPESAARPAVVEQSLF